MSALISKSSVVQAWTEGVRHLSAMPSHSDFNVILEIEDPLVVLAGEAEKYAAVNKLLRASGDQSLETVANTIFPQSLYRKHGERGVYEIYPNDVYPKIRKLPTNSWGTYAHRLVRRVNQKGKELNPLQEIVRRLHTEAEGASHKRSRFELNLVDPFVDLNVSDPGLPGDTKALGGPCLSHLSFKLTDDKRLALTAFYRSHYYIQRALGNLVGLGNLMQFVSMRAGIATGQLTCISSYAILDTAPHRGLAEVRALVNQG